MYDIIVYDNLPKR